LPKNGKTPEFDLISKALPIVSKVGGIIRRAGDRRRGEEIGDRDGRQEIGDEETGDRRQETGDRR